MWQDVRIAMTLVVAVLAVACGGSGSSAPTAPSPSAASATSVTFSGTVTNIVTGTTIGGATVTIGSTAATSNADGTYSL